MNFFPFIFLFFFAFGSSFLKGEEASQPAVTDPPLSPAFYPIDSWPKFSDFKTVLQTRTPDFINILPPFATDCFYKFPCSKMAVSNHYVKWGEIIDFLNNVAWRTGNDVRQLYTGTLAQNIKRKLETQPKEGTLFSQSYYTYELVSPELAMQPALLSLSTMQRYVNWRESHYWRYGRLLDQEQGITHCEDDFVSYLKKQLLWPMIDPAATPSIDNLDDIVEKSTEFGTYCFSADGSHVERMEPKASYRLPTAEEILTWTSRRGGEADSWNEIVWGMNSYPMTDTQECSAFNVNGEPESVSQECYGLLALNTEKMESNPNFQKEEAILQKERAHFDDFVEQDLLERINLEASYNQEEEANESFISFWGGTIIGAADMASLVYTIYQGFRWGALYSASITPGLRRSSIDLRCFRLFSDEESEAYLVRAMNLDTKGEENNFYQLRLRASRNGGGTSITDPEAADEIPLPQHQVPENAQKLLNDRTHAAKINCLKGGIVTSLLHSLGNSLNTTY